MLALLCASQLLVFLDATIVNVALPAIAHGLHFGQASLAWVINAYLLAFGGFLLLAGRAGDLFGRKRIFAAALMAFTVASLGCAVAVSRVALIAARAAQGLAAAGVSATGLSMIVTLHDDPSRRARALGIFSFVASGGGTLGVIAGGMLAELGGWRAIFLINVPLGAVLLVLTRTLIAPDRPTARGDLDALGSCIRRGRRAPAALVPLDMIGNRALLTANVLAALLRAAMFVWFFFSALLMQRQLGFSPLQVGLGFLPATATIGAFSAWLTPRVVQRRGARFTFVLGAALAAAGLASYALAPSRPSFAADVLPRMLLVGAGGGLLFMPLVLLATSALPREHAGLASGLLSTAQQLGAAIGLALLAALPSQTAFIAAGASTAVAAAAGTTLARSHPRSAA